MRAIGPESSWIAIRANDPEVLRAAFGFSTLEPVEFDRGLAEARRKRRRAFVAAPAGDWTLVVVDLGPAELFALAERAGKSGNDVHAFVCRARTDHFAWLRITAGAVERAFERRGERTLRDEGARRRDEPDASEVGESRVLELAGSWSVDPTSFARRGDSAGAWLGAWERERPLGPAWTEVLAGALGAVGIVAIEIGAILALGRVFARTSHWWLAALAGAIAVIVASTLRPGFRPRRALLLAGVALALGAVLGGAFPHRPD